MDLGVQVFRLSEESFRQTKKKQRLFGAFCVGLVVVMLTATGVWGMLDLRFTLVILGVLVVLAVSGSLGATTQLVRGHRTWGLAIGPEVLRLVSASAPPVEMTRSEVVRVQESPKGLVLEAESPARAVFVPASTERYALARELLAAWRTPEPFVRRGPPQGVTLGALALAFLAWIGGKNLESPELAGACAVLYLGIASWFIWIVFREPLVPPRSRASLVILVALGLVTLIWRFAKPMLAGGAS
ncbi:MAG TPA: hypothetical protein VFF12_04440 [Myxococcaceae bacterium]|nr:hypothetical protein [Myxococcaceae bacterium]